MAALQQHVAAVKRAYFSQDAHALLAAFRIDPGTFGAIQADLNRDPNRDLSAWVLGQIPVSASPTDSERFQSLVADFLAYVRDHAPLSYASAASQAPAMADWDRAYDAWALVYSRASAFFSLPDTVWFASSLRFFASSLVTLAMAVDHRTDAVQKRKTTDAAGRLSKAAGMAGNDRSQARGSETKRAAVLMLANLSFKAYFKLNNTRLCETVLGSVENALKLNRTFAANNGQNDESGEQCYSRADRVTYRYYLGRLRLFQHNIRAASTHLRWAFDNCTLRNLRNKRAILIPLVATYLILGRYPEPALLEASNLSQTYGALMFYLKNGQAAAAMDELDRHMDWLRFRGLYLILREKLQISLWRNLARRCLALSYGPAQASSAPPTLRVDMLLSAARLAWRDPSLQPSDIEAILASLIDQGFVKGYILHSKGVLVLQKGPHMGFPPIWTVFNP
ncbi:related to protein that forms a complex with Thp3p [Moesziomyces antarcticus]|uniref:Related to protein that forms a complex with Thp3p n=2 Tax=Pseudozyma antarctica TaxID=84753 RepID=A0A5C3FKM2_PSEA2|nr:related to protein that forms a complex with Thp3p [Moesziomyces antarcticus]